MIYTLSILYCSASDVNGDAIMGSLHNEANLAAAPQVIPENCNNAKAMQEQQLINRQKLDSQFERLEHLNNDEERRELLRILKKQAEQDNYISYKIGLYYYERKDLPEAEKYLRQPAKDDQYNHAESQYLYGMCVQHEDDKLAYLELADKQGHKPASFELGKYYYDKQPKTKENAEKALKYFKKSGDSRVAGILENSDDSEYKYVAATSLKLSDQNKAAKVFYEAAQKWHTGSKEELKKMANNYSEPSNKRRKININENSAGIAQKNSTSEANLYLGNMYRDGKGVYPNLSKAAFYYHRSACAGNAEAKNALEKLSQTNQEVNIALGILNNDVEKIAKEAKQGCKRAFKQLEEFTKTKENSSLALYHLGLIYKNALGVLQDEKKADVCFIQAAELGNIEALSEIKENTDLMKQLKNNTNENNSTGFIKVIDNISKQLLNNIETAKNVNLLSNISGYSGYAYNKLGEYYEKNSNVEDMVSNYTKASAAGSCAGKLNLARCYTLAKGTIANYQKANVLYDSLEKKECANYYYNQGMLLAEKKNFAEAKTKFELALAANIQEPSDVKTNGYVYYHLANALLKYVENHEQDLNAENLLHDVSNLCATCEQFTDMLGNTSISMLATRLSSQIPNIRKKLNVIDLVNKSE